MSINISFGFLQLIGTVLLVLLKLGEFIDCSWLWVFAPLWLPLLIAIIVGAIVIVFFKGCIK